ncbi:GTP 3',8-cyclase MoaA [Wenzhouxiangella sp. AB-CW3]|uniref:GTP 3',8-cyclase MoaA n=1 Tax=Wenzhouxiangella sp. AB-CW3 TaxID=2771012 RepID=UPI00168ABE00|nr:GTP 3',8-cyclase MoaA [Wenzhouxiangella sp. AB-CW3]QOC22453.1 GTP 3',8-cyclase MoaA [Wenzhouxiangella sp. AB-CW3]
MTQLKDGFGRRFSYLRLSVTDVCNFRCEYCLPNGYQGKPTGFLDHDEIRRLVTAFAELGTWKIRLTGGEPTVRKDFLDIVRTVRAAPGVQRIAMTTNAFRLAQDAAKLKDAGMDAVNISLDGLDAEHFKRITGDKRFDKVMAGIDAALAHGFDAVKINTVLLKGLNDEQLPAFFEFVRKRPVSVRFIELMRTGDNGEYFEKRHVGGQLVRDQLDAAGWTPMERGEADGPAIEYRHPEHAGRIGIIAPYAPGFCDTCNRLRVTARGGLRLCLFGNGTGNLRPLLQSDEQKEELKATVLTALFGKRVSHFLHDGDYGDTPHLAMTGG